MSDRLFCCDRFAFAATPPTSSVMGPPDPYPNANRAMIEESQSPGEWNVWSGRNGGGYALTGIRYCPFCGMFLAHYPSRVRIPTRRDPR